MPYKVILYRHPISMSPVVHEDLRRRYEAEEPLWAEVMADGRCLVRSRYVRDVNENGERFMVWEGVYRDMDAVNFYITKVLEDDATRVQPVYARHEIIEIE